jgi:Resolvase, N terminal domain
MLGVRNICCKSMCDLLSLRGFSTYSTQQHADWLCSRLDRRSKPRSPARCPYRRRLRANLRGQSIGVRDDRPGLAEALSHLRRGDCLVIWRLDRLGRRMIALLSFVEELRRRGCDFRILNGSFPIDTTTASGRLLFHISAALAENERDMIRERTVAGLASARARGRKGGRPPKLSSKQVRTAK